MELFKENHIVGNETQTIKIPGVESWTLTQLRHCCKKNKAKGYTKMNREELIKEVKNIISGLGDNNAADR